MPTEEQCDEAIKRSKNEFWLQKQLGKDKVAIRDLCMRLQQNGLEYKLVLNKLLGDE